MFGFIVYIALKKDVIEAINVYWTTIIISFYFYVLVVVQILHWIHDPVLHTIKLEALNSMLYECIYW
jgi:hypothetical protein